MAATKDRMMEVYRLTLNTDGTVDAEMRNPADATNTDPAYAPGPGGGVADRMRYNGKSEAPGLGQRMKVTYTPETVVAASEKGGK